MYDLKPLYKDEEFMKEVKECEVCGARYKTIEAIGKLQCRYHPGTPYGILSYETGIYRYSCCGQPVDNKDPSYRKELRYGCTPADHTILDRPYQQCDGLETTEYPPESLRNSNSIVTYDKRHSRYTLWRYDRVQAEYRIHYGTYSRDVDNRLKGYNITISNKSNGDDEYEFSCSEDDEIDDEEFDDDTDDDGEGIPLFSDAVINDFMS